MGDLRHHNKSPKPWSPEEHQQMVALKNAGNSIKEICRILDRASSSVSGRWKNTDVHGNFVSRRDRVSLAEMEVDDYLLEMHRIGWSQEKIGMSIGFRPTAIGSRIRMLLAKEGQPTVENPDRKKRPCIMQCGREFVSDSWKVRLCSSCRRKMAESDVFSKEWSIHV